MALKLIRPEKTVADKVMNDMLEWVSRQKDAPQSVKDHVKNQAK
jgi:hypothetical protein